jgi:NtrC-family two-component system sensor histidine kinase KinB
MSEDFQLCYTLRGSSMAEDRTRALLELLYYVSREVATTLELRTVLQRVLYAATQYVGGERGSIVVLDNSGQPLDATIVFGQRFHEHTTQRLRETVDRGLAGWVIRHRKPALIADTSRDKRWLRRPDDAKNQTGAKSTICVPLLAREQLVGVLTLVHPAPNAFGQGHLELMQAIANQAGTAIHNARLYERLQVAHQRYYELFEDSIDPIIITDRGGRILEANRQSLALSGYTEKQLYDMSIDQLHEIDRERAGPGFDNLWNESTSCYESHLNCQGGETLPVEVYVRRVHFEDSESLQWTLRDIRERKALDHLRDDLTLMIYHDLRSPLSNISSSLDLLGGMLANQEEEAIHSLLAIMKNSADRIQRLISSLLDINRLEAGQEIVNQQSVEAVGLMQSVIDDVKPQADGRQQVIVSKLPANLPPIWVDADMIGRVLINLLENAIKHTPVKGRIKVGAEQDGEWLRMWVKDSGRGIPARDRERIFDKFTRLRDRDAPSGYGVGLAFCRLAVEGHGGRIWVESRADKGARFIFMVPLVPARQTA